MQTFRKLPNTSPNTKNPTTIKRSRTFLQLVRGWGNYKDNSPVLLVTTVRHFRIENDAPRHSLEARSQAAGRPGSPKCAGFPADRRHRGGDKSVLSLLLCHLARGLH